jgi:hypothetical protein
MDMPEGANVAVPGTYSLVQSSLSNKGNPTSQGFNNLMLVEQDQPVRIVDKTGEVLFEGTGPEAARQAVVIGQDLTNTIGKKAGWDIQTVPVGTSNFKTIANEKVDKNVLGTIADIGLPILASALIPGGGLLGTILPAAAGSAASSVAQGRSLQDTLLRAAIAGGGAGLGESIFGAGLPSGNAVAPTASLAADVMPNLPSLLDEIAATAAQNVASAGLGSIAPAVLPSIAGDIVATAIKTAAPSIAGSAIGSTAGSLLSSAMTPETIVQAQTQPQYDALSVTPPVSLPENILVSAQTPPPQFEAPPVAPPVSFLENILVNAETQPTTQPETPRVTPPVSFPENILVNAQAQTQPIAPTPVILPSITTPTPSLFNPAEDIIATAQTQTQPVTPTPVVVVPTTPPNVPPLNPAEDIKVTAPKNTQVITPPLIPPVFQPPAITPDTIPTDTTPPAKKDDFLGTGLSLTQLATITGLGTSLLGSLLGGGGTGTTPTTPYVSPFGTGAGTGFGTGMDYRAQPNILDYERYGFGPEAMFFRPEYSRLVSGASAAPAAPAASTTPIYQPLI